MKITKAKIKSLKPCADGWRFYLENSRTDLLEFLLLCNKEHPNWARWLFTHLMTVKERRRIAIFAAEQVLPIFEAKYPNDKRPRDAIVAAKAVLRKDTAENRSNARAAYAAHAAAYAAYAAHAAHAAAYAAHSAYAAAYAAADAAAYAAAYAAHSAYAAAYAAHAAADASAADRKEMQDRIIREAVRLLDGRRKRNAKS